MSFTLDTSILLGLLRNASVWRRAKDEYIGDKDTEDLIISIVTEGELWAIAEKRGYGKSKRRKIQGLIPQFLRVPIRYQDLIDRYADIDAYSQNKHPHYDLGLTSRKMGKNDLWIAATASATNTSLITTDGNFDHLIGSPFLRVIKV